MKQECNSTCDGCGWLLGKEDKAFCLLYGGQLSATNNQYVRLSVCLDNEKVNQNEKR